jgi:hypothetical protein
MRWKLTVATWMVTGSLLLAACGTVVGTAAGAGIGSIAGDTKTGAIIGGSAGLLYDIFN